jgi:Uma2 family endonuclease
MVAVASLSKREIPGRFSTLAHVRREVAGGAESSKLSRAVTEHSGVAVQYSLPNSLPEWELPEVPVPESPEHDEIAERLRSTLSAWIRAKGLTGAVPRNLAIRWDALHPRVGVDPDVCWVDPLPPGWSEGEIDSLRLWLPGHHVPRLAIEITSRSHPYKDYGRVQDKYAAVGVSELWVYDHRRFGPRALGGPALLQLWSRTDSGVLVCRHRGDDPVQSELTGAWLVPHEGRSLQLADDAAGSKPWPTLEESERARAENERARADTLAAELAALRRGNRSAT